MDKAKAVAGAIQRGEKVIEISGHLFTRTLYRELAANLGKGRIGDWVDEAFDAAPSWQHANR